MKDCYGDRTALLNVTGWVDVSRADDYQDDTFAEVPRLKCFCTRHFFEFLLIFNGLSLKKASFTKYDK